MSSVSDNNKRIAKNTVFLYGRTIILLCITLYSSRIVLEELGVEDYGIYNVVGGVVAMFSLISGSLSGAINRYLTFGLGKGDIKRLTDIFSTSINIQLTLSLIILIVGEIVGIWLINNKLNLPVNRIYAVHWVLQGSLFVLVLSLINIPYNAIIIAHERMKTFAYASILETLLKLGCAFLLFITPFDRLITYVVALTFSSLIMRIVYGIYCSRNFKECHYLGLKMNASVVKEMASFAGWNFFGSTTYLFNTQGVNILINIYFGVSLNAARGVVAQVDAAITQFVNSFTMALNPQIIKSYAQGNSDYMYSLICRGTKFSYFLMLLFIIPLWFEAPIVLHLWLKNVPEFSVVFLRLSLIATSITTIANTQVTAILATGNIKNYELAVTSVGCLVFLLSWLAYYWGAPAQSTYWIYIAVYFFLHFIRIWFLRKLTYFPIKMLFKQTIIPIIVSTPLVIIMPLIIVSFMESTFLRLVILVISSSAVTVFSTMIFGMTQSERNIIINKAKQVISHH